MPLPSDLLKAVADHAGGKLALIVGAGCSVEDPTGMPLSRVCSEEIFQRLVLDGVLQNNDCAHPGDLSLIADAVFAKRHSQKEVVSRLKDRYNFKHAAPNSGYLIVAAMLSEGALASVVTLNFDLALSNAISELGLEGIGVIESSEDLPHRKRVNVYYLHRNVNAHDPETWVLRTEALKKEWRDHWEQVIATAVLATPVVVFAGLGTPVTALLESASLIRKALPKTLVYQVDLLKAAESEYFKQLSLKPDQYLQLGWCCFMEELSQRLVSEQLLRLAGALDSKVKADALPVEKVEGLLQNLERLGLVTAGRVRATWLLYHNRYFPCEQSSLGHVADLLLGLALIARISGAEPVIAEDGVVEFERDGRVVAVFMVASGRGVDGKLAVEVKISTRRRYLRARRRVPLGAIIAGTTDSWTTSVTVPEEVVPKREADNIVDDRAAFPMVHVGELRVNSALISQLVP